MRDVRTISHYGFIRGVYGFLDSKKLILIEEEIEPTVQMNSDALHVMRYDILYLGKLGKLELFVTVEKLVMYSQKKMLEQNMVPMGESNWFRHLNKELELNQ